MTHNTNDYSTNDYSDRSVKKAGRDFKIIGGNNTEGSHNFLMPLIMIGVLALGSAWGLGLRIKLEPQGLQIGGDIQPQKTQLTK